MFKELFICKMFAKDYVSMIGIVLVLLIAVFPRLALAREIIIKNSGNSPYILDTVMHIHAEDTVRIVKGTRIEVREGGGFYIRGNLFIGLDDSIESGGQHLATSNTVIIRSSSTLPFIEVDGGAVIGIDIDYKGTVFLSGFRGSEVVFSSSTLFDSTAGIITAHQPFIAIYQNSKFELSHSKIISKIDPNNTETTQPRVGYEHVIGYGGYPLKEYLVEIYSTSHATITDTNIYSEISQVVLGVYGESGIKFENSQILSCERWLMLFNISTASGNLNNSYCHAQPQYVFNESVSTIVFEDTDCCASVLFIPGLQGSRLYRKQVFENRLWEPNTDSDIEKLFMTEDGESINDIYAKDVLDKVEISGFGVNSLSYYSNFIKSLQSYVDQRLIVEYQLHPYDWRYNPDYLADSYLIQRIESMANLSYNGKVTLVTHSYGGLVAKSLLKKILDSKKTYLIDKVVLVAVPETGAPAALFSSMHGENQALLWGFAQKATTAMKLALNMPSAYMLMPNNYSKNIGLKMNIPDNNLSVNNSITGSVSMDQNLQWLRQFTNNKKLSNDSIPIQNKSNINLENKADILMSMYNSQKQIFESKFNIWSIAGTGMQTISGMDYSLIKCKKILCGNQYDLLGNPIYISEGDGTVVLDNQANRLGKLLKVNLPELNKFNKSNIKHANILESKDIQDAIRSIIVTNEPVEQGGYIYIEDNPVLPEKIYLTHATGNITGGISEVNNNIEYKTAILKNLDKYSLIEQVPNSSISKIGQSIQITSQSAPENINFESETNQRISIGKYIINSPTGNWNSSVNNSNNISNNSSSVGISGYVFANIAVNNGSVINIDTSSSSPVLEVDFDNDGDVDREYPAVDIEDLINGTSTATSTSQASISNMIYEIENILSKIETFKSNVLSLKMKGIKNTHINHLNKSKANLSRVLNNLRKYFGHDGLIVNSMEDRILTTEIGVVYKDLQTALSIIKRLKEQELVYSKQIISIDKYMKERGSRGVSAQVIAKKANAQNHLDDIGKLYLVFSDLEDLELEFLDNHGSILFERLQRP